MTSDSITVVRSRTRRLSKLIHPDGRIDDYDLARTVDLYPVPVGNLDEVGELLHELLPRPDCAVARAEVIDPARTMGVRRLLHPDPETGETPTLREAARMWLALDLDGVGRPESLPPADLAGCASYAVQRLPTAFHGVRCIVQASAGHGIKPGCRLRLWYWCSRAVSGEELKRWLAGATLDKSVFRPAQLIYTAAPVFAGMGTDHLPHRITWLPGVPHLSVPSAEALAPPPPKPLPALPRPSDAGASRYAAAALRNSATRVAAAPVNSRHDTILGEARRLARFVGAGLLSEHDIRAVIVPAAEHAGKPASEAESIITWAFAHPSTAQLPEGIAA